MAALPETSRLYLHAHPWVETSPGHRVAARLFQREHMQGQVPLPGTREGANDGIVSWALSSSL